ncbi:EAL domain-containing protein [Methylobacterium sp. J-077]|uniref:EAL domain-containing protein n=1 Tax=Methylobacterium sp. J-077 TaxID=2836656 RepID=UPI001FBB07C0|nr:EAL domain-containing protein [Methylobacterium sp. J-077]MCJ2123146.1 EAL domain-containing protein [Methylobacterium sp. J-077]
MPVVSPPSLHRVHLCAGVTLFREGDSGDAAYLIEEGRLEIFATRSDGDLVLACRGPGEVVGEMAILDGGKRSATVRALADSVLIVITREQLARRISGTDPILRMCLSVVLERYRATVARLEGASGRSACPPPPDTHNPSPYFREAIEMLRLEQEIQSGIDRAEFFMVFQPIVSLDTGYTVGFEALMRWQHPERGLLPPSEFIPVAESSGLISRLTLAALRMVAELIPQLPVVNRPDGTGREKLFLNLNIAAQDLFEGGFLELLEKFVREGRFEASSLRFEVTESGLIKDPDRSIATLCKLREYGFGVAIDDFGTGYSSLNYLSTLPATAIKIDRGFVRSMLDDPKSFKIIQMIVRLADELGLPVVAEGIERPEQAQALDRMGCVYGQGYLYGKPMQFEDAVDLIVDLPR